MAGRAEYNQLYWEHQALKERNKSLENEIAAVRYQLEKSLEAPKPPERTLSVANSDDMFDMEVVPGPSKTNLPKVPKRAGK